MKGRGYLTLCRSILALIPVGGVGRGGMVDHGGDEELRRNV